MWEEKGKSKTEKIVAQAKNDRETEHVFEDKVLEKMLKHVNFDNNYIILSNLITVWFPLEKGYWCHMHFWNWEDEGVSQTLHPTFFKVVIIECLDPIWFQKVR